MKVIKGKHFKVDVEINNNLLDSTLRQDVSVLNVFPSDCLGYMQHVIENMNSVEFSSFVELICSYEPLVHIIFQLSF